MPGGRQISGRDVVATLERFGGGRGDGEALRAAVRSRRFASYDELLRAAPPERVGLSSGAHRLFSDPCSGSSSEAVLTPVSDSRVSSIVISLLCHQLGRDARS